MLIDRGASVNSQDHDQLTPIFYAAKFSQLHMVDFLLQQGADLHHTDELGRDIFYFAASLNQLTALKHFYSLGCDPNAQTKLGRTALSKSAWNGYVEVIKLLLSYPEIQLDIQDSKGRSALHNAAWGSAGGRTGRKMGESGRDSPEIVKLLIEAGANIELEDSRKNTPLCISASTDAQLSLDVLLQHGANIYHQNKHGHTPLHEAIKHGAIQCVQKLLQSGISANHPGGKEKTPVMCSIQYDQYAILQLLVETYNSEVKYEYLDTCVHFNRPNLLEYMDTKIQQEQYEENLLCKAIEMDREKCVEFLLPRCPVNTLCIITAIEKGSKFIDQLLEKWQGELPAEVFVQALKTSYNWRGLLERTRIDDSCLQAAIIAEEEEVAIEILKRWPQLSTHIFENQRTPLHLAALTDLSGFAAQLLSQFEDPKEFCLKLDGDGLTAETLANIYKKHSIAAYLNTVAQSNQELRVLQIDYEDEDIELPPHPLQNELQVPEYPELPEQPDETELIWVDTEEGIQNCWEYVQQYTVIGLDLEYYSFDSKRGVIAIIQLSAGDRDYIIDAFQNREKVAEFMQRLMLDQNIVKVLHGCEADVIWLQTDLKAYCAKVFDTARAYKVLQGQNVLPSLALLVKTYFGVDMDKTFQVADWRIRPLPKPMLDYARYDSRYLCKLYSILRAQLSGEQLVEVGVQCNGILLKVLSGKMLPVKAIVRQFRQL